MKEQDYNIKVSKIKDAKKHVLIVHGYAEHIERYDKLYKLLNARGCSVYGMDLRGHGKSKGKRAYINSFDEYLSDLDHIIGIIGHDKPLSIFGHSMGALIITKWLLKRDNSKVEKIVLSSGLFMLDDSVAPFLRKIAKYISFIAPTFKANKIESSKISRVKEEIYKYDNDPLIYREGTRARTGYEIMKAMKYVQENASKITQKAMILQGDEDILTNMAGSELLYENLGAEHKSLHIIQGGYHELINDECEKEVLDLIVGFIAT